MKKLAALIALVMIAGTVQAQTRPCRVAGEVFVSSEKTYRCDDQLQWNLDGATEEPKGFFRPYGPAFRLSLGIAVAGIAADIASSNNLPSGLREAGFSSNRQGGVSNPKAIAFNAAVLVPSIIWGEKKNPRVMFWARILGIGGFHFALALHNQRLKKAYR